MKSRFNFVVRIVLGLILLTAGLNKFLNFFEMPEMAEPAQQFMSALMETGYMLPLIASTEIVVGVLLLSKLLVPLGLVLLAPVSVNIILFHLFLDPSTIFLGLVVALANFYLIITYRKYYYPMLHPE